jgi:hypothetical protein
MGVLIVLGPTPASLALFNDCLFKIFLEYLKNIPFVSEQNL